MHRITLPLVFSAAVAVMARAAETHTLSIHLEPRFNSRPLTFDVVTNTIAAGQIVSVQRLDLLLSNIALRRADGVWLGLTNWFAYLSAREGRTSFELNQIPSGQYDRARFFVGLPPEINHRDPAQYPANHPLNPNVNGLHWNWQGGYVFLALEGNWSNGGQAAARGKSDLPNRSARLERQPAKAATPNPAPVDTSGYSYHIATDRQLMTVELPLSLDLQSDHQLALALNLDKVFGGMHTVTLSGDMASTHSREGDELGNWLRANVERAFAVERVIARQPVTLGKSPTGKREMAGDATPYRLTIPRYFSRPALPTDNPLTEEGVRLGALLFFDPRLSLNNSQSCASCHQAEAAFTNPGKAVSRGAEGHLGTRNSMPLFNLAWKSSFFWDGRAASLREQVLQPIQNPIEMHETLEAVVAKLKSSRVNSRHQARALQSYIGNPPSEAAQSLQNSAAATRKHAYPFLFAQAFGTPDITADRMARALEQFLLVQVSRDSKFDRFIKGEIQLTPEEKRGFELFHTEYDPRRSQFGADCFHCHGGPLFQNQSFANNGLDADFKDLGRYLTTKRDGDKGKFAVPSLRNVAVTAPYMHDGRFKTLEEVVEHYTGGVKCSSTLDPNLAKHPGGGVPLSAADKQALIAFLKTLTDERFTKLVP